jgi:hypothetical protein
VKVMFMAKQVSVLKGKKEKENQKGIESKLS